MGENVHRRSRKERKSISEDNVNLWMWQISADNPSLSVANARKIDTRYAQTYWRDFKEIVFSYIQHTLSVYLSLSLPIFLPCLSICILLSSFFQKLAIPSLFSPSNIQYECNDSNRIFLKCWFHTTDLWCWKRLRTVPTEPQPLPDCQLTLSHICSSLNVYFKGTVLGLFLFI